MLNMAEGSHASHSLELHRAFDWSVISFDVALIVVMTDQVNRRVLLIELLVCGALYVTSTLQIGPLLKLFS